MQNGKCDCEQTGQKLPGGGLERHGYSMIVIIRAGIWGIRPRGRRVSNHEVEYV